MSTDPTEIRAQIENTRANLSEDVDALAYRANPAHVAERQVAKVKESGSRLLDRVLGSAEDVRDSAVDTMHSVGDVPDAARRRTQGNPLAAGAVAFGLGLLVAAAFPPSRKEQQLAEDLKEKAQPLTDKVTSAAQDVAQNLSGPAQDAVDSLKESATDAVAAVQQEGTEAVADVQDAAQNPTYR